MTKMSKKWKVTYELPTRESDWWYGETAEEAAAACRHNGPIGAKVIFVEELKDA